jgi:hypothetical protein
LKKLTVPIYETFNFSEEEFEEYLEPLSAQDKPPLDAMLIKARQEEGEQVRKTIRQTQSARPKVSEIPKIEYEVPEFMSAFK